VNGLQHLRSVIDQTVVLRFPRHRLATFGDSEIPYHLITPHPELPQRSTLRIGMVKALRPKILTPDSFLKRFEGFGEDADGFERLLKDNFEDLLRGLEYVFHNRVDDTISHHRDAHELAQSVHKDLDERDQPRAAVIMGPEQGWSLSLMKFALEESGRSFPLNMRELDERGLFDPAGVELRRRKADIESLFRAARDNAAALPVLAAKLKEHGLFDEYQDRFFALVK
jgi:hypothetical protein